MDVTLKLIVFGLGTLGLNLAVLPFIEAGPRTRFYRIFAWELIPALILCNLEFWFF